MAEKLPFLKVRGTKITTASGKGIMLRGVALGGWLMMEGYMSAGRNIPEKIFREEFSKAFGKDELAQFTREFRDTYIQEEDIRRIKGWGANCVRIPFNYRIVEFEDRAYSFNEEGLKYLDSAVEWCERNGIYCILDMHAAPGGQNPDWHADCVGKPEFFTNDFNKDRFFRLWRFLSDRYKSSSAVAGYDVINEPFISFLEEDRLKEIYDRVVAEIRDTDKEHIIFLEGNFWAQRISFLGRPKDKNVAYSIHTYPPPEYVFNLEPGLTYPGKVYNITWNKNKLDFFARQYAAFAKKADVPIYVGEFGIAWRGGHFGEDRWVNDMVDLYKKYGFHWTYWTYKTVANYTYPDGLIRYIKNPSWVKRGGPVTGWENFYTTWQKERSHIVDSWKTGEFEPNDKLIGLLKKYWQRP